MKLPAHLLLALISGLILSFGSMAHAQEKPDIPFWRLAAELNAAGYQSHTRFEWSDANLEKMVNTVPTLKNLRSLVSENIKFKAGDTNPGYSGFTTRLKDKLKTIMVQVYYEKPKKNIDVAITVGHELIHAYHYSDGMTAYWQSRIILPEGSRYAECQTELGAYTWASMYWSNAQDQKWYSEQISKYQSCVNQYNKKYKL